MLIKELRQKRGLTQKQLADRLGIAPNTLSQYETGQREPNIETLLALSRELGVGVSELLGVEEKKPLVNGDEELTEYLDMLSTRSECRLLFSLAKDASREDVERAVRIIEALKAEHGSDVDA